MLMNLSCHLYKKLFLSKRQNYFLNITSSIVFFQSQDQKFTSHPQKTCQPIIVLSVKIVSIELPLSNKAISLTKFQSNCWVGQLTVIEMPAVPKGSMFVIEACC